MHRDDTLIGLDVKTKDLDGKAYSDGGVCSVDNLIQFLVRDRAILLLAEIAHQSDGNRGRRVAEVGSFRCTCCQRLTSGLRIWVLARFASIGRFIHSGLRLTGTRPCQTS